MTDTSNDLGELILYSFILLIVLVFMGFFIWFIAHLPVPYSNLSNGSNGSLTVSIGQSADITEKDNRGAVLFTYGGITDGTYVFNEWFHNVVYIPISQSSFNVETGNGNFTIDNIKINSNGDLSFNWYKIN
jgi:hypothetical protein